MLKQTQIANPSTSKKAPVADFDPSTVLGGGPVRGTSNRGHFFQDIHLKGSIQIALGIGAVAAFVNELAEMNAQTSPNFSPLNLLQQYGLYASCCFLALVFAQKVSFEGLLWKRSKSRSSKTLDLFAYGALPGILIGLVYTKQFIPFRYSPLVPIWIRLIQSPYDTIIYSLRAAITEELVFRFLLFTGFFYILARIFQPLIEQGRAMARWIPLLFSVLISSLLFGIAHGLFGFASAFLASLILCLCFVRGGFESVALCHFIADFVFYNLVYLHVGGLHGI